MVSSNCKGRKLRKWQVDWPENDQTFISWALSVKTLEANENLREAFVCFYRDEGKTQRDKMFNALRNINPKNSCSEAATVLPAWSTFLIS